MKLAGDPGTWLQGSETRKRAVFGIWAYDTVRFLMIYNFLESYGINPFVFFFFDMVTVPGYVNGWTRLLGSLTDSRQKLVTIFTWSIVTFFMSTAPYLYAAWAGRQSLSSQAWLVLFLVMVFPAIHIAKRITPTKT